MVSTEYMGARNIGKQASTMKYVYRKLWEYLIHCGRGEGVAREGFLKAMTSK